MGDHFVLLMNRLTTDSALEAAIESEGRIPQVLMSPSKESTADISIGEMTTTILSTPRELVQCRICHDEDELLNMETPCSCCGSLKYAHRNCVQRWCSEKGDTTCEICRQFIVLLVLKHTLPIVLIGAGDYLLTLFTILVFIMAKAFSAIQRRHQQVPHMSLETSNEENELRQMQPLPRFIHI